MPPGAVKRRFRPKFHYELIVCGLRGHVLVGTDAEEVRREDSAFVREYERHALVPLPALRRVAAAAAARAPERRFPPERSEIELPTRGRALRDKIVLRLIAIDRALHFLILGSLAALAFMLASHRGQIVHLVDRLNVLFFGTQSGTSARARIHARARAAR